MTGCLSLLCCLNRLRGGALCSFGKEILNQKRQIFTDIFSRVDKLNKLKEHTVSNCATCLFSYGNISNKHFWISIIIWLCCKQHLFLSLNVFGRKQAVRVMDIPFHVSQQHQLAGKKHQTRCGKICWRGLLNYTMRLFVLVVLTHVSLFSPPLWSFPALWNDSRAVPIR